MTRIRSHENLSSLGFKSRTKKLFALMVLSIFAINSIFVPFVSFSNTAKVSADEIVGTLEIVPDIQKEEVVETSVVDDEESLETVVFETPVIESQAVVAQPSEPSVTVHIRYNSNLVFEGQITLSSTTLDIVDNNSVTRQIAGSSTLAAIILADRSDSDFDVSDLAYYQSFDSYLINCVQLRNQESIPDETNACYNWQFVVNDTYPFVGMDDYILADGDDVYMYFGTKNRLTLPTEPVYSTLPFDVLAEKYEYTSNTWSPLPGITVGGTQPDPTNPWSPLVITSTTSIASGYATLALNATGTYGIGIAEEYYYPTQDLVVLDIALKAPITTSTNATSTATTTAPTTATSTATTTVPSTATTTSSSAGGSEGIGSGGGGGGGSTPSSFSLLNAISFIKSKENGGFYGASLYADWATIALVAYGNSSTADVRNYLVNNPISSDNLLDYARRSMSLMSLGINPYSGTSKNYISEIAKSFDGTQFGNIGLINDDIFSVLVLSKSGYLASDIEISKSISFILSKQQSSGAFDGVDMTAAAIQTLSQFSGDPAVSGAIQKAKQYLKSTQDAEGGWGNTSATAWVMQAIASLGESDAQWTRGSKTPVSFLASKQATDGGVGVDMDINSRVWATSYAVTGYMSKPWTSIMQSFSKAIVVGGGIGNGNGTLSSTSTLSTSAGTSTTTSVTTTIASVGQVLGASTDPGLPTNQKSNSSDLPLFDFDPSLKPNTIVANMSQYSNATGNSRQTGSIKDNSENINEKGEILVVGESDNASGIENTDIKNSGNELSAKDSIESIESQGLQASTKGVVDYIRSSKVATALALLMLASLLGLAYLGYNKSRK